MEHEALKRRTLGSVLWMVAASSWASVASFVTFAILARLLDPFTFGTFSLAQSVFLIVTTLITSGVNDVIIQRRDLTEELADTLFWTNVGLGLLGAAVVWISADHYAQVMKVPEAASPLRLLALAIPLEVLATVHLARSLRVFAHKVVAFRTFASTLIGVPRNGRLEPGSAGLGDQLLDRGLRLERVPVVTSTSIFLEIARFRRPLW